MPRSVAEWVGKTDNTRVPFRVRLRVLDRFNGACAGCFRRILAAEKWQVDHRCALINGGPNRETNLEPLCEECHARKTLLDLAEKSKVARTRKKHLGLRKPRRPMPGSKASGLRKRMDGTVERR